MATQPVRLTRVDPTFYRWNNGESALALAYVGANIARDRNNGGWTVNWFVGVRVDPPGPVFVDRVSTLRDVRGLIAYVAENFDPDWRTKDWQLRDYLTDLTREAHTQ